MTQVAETRDRDLLRAVFARDPIGAIYQLADFEDGAFAHCRWHTAGERAVLLVYTALAVPVVLPFGDPDALRSIVSNTPLPSRFYTKLDASQETLFTGYGLDAPDELYVMGLAALEAVAPVPGVSCALAADPHPIAPLYDDYPGNYFDPAQVASGVYAAAYLDGEPVAVAGTHAYAPREHAAALGNVVTARGHRGQGICRVLMHFLCTELARRGVRHIGLHVSRGNDPAISCYRRVGFTVHSAITQWTAVRNG